MENNRNKFKGTYSGRYLSEHVPKDVFPENGISSRAAYAFIHEELNLDGNPELNLATFVTTWMEPEADKLYMENAHKNFIDNFEYPQIKKIETRIIKILSELYSLGNGKNFFGASTIGSSESIMLALLAHKWNWKNKMKSKGKDYSKPNIVFGADTHVVWDKFARYFDVEPKIVPLDNDTLKVSPEKLVSMVDENTIAVGAVMGTTFTGAYDDVKKLNQLLENLKNKTGNDVPIHVDAASGGFITPFIEPELEWDFRLNHVKSINVSGHKFGLVYPGLGWILFRDKKDLPDDLMFYVNYLGDEMPTYTLNFSRSSSNIAAQYYNILRMGKMGYRKIAMSVMDNAKYLAEKLKNIKEIELVSTAEHIPVITFKKISKDGYSLFDLSSEMKKFGWIIPAYSLPENASNIVLMRIVVREGLSTDMIDLLYDNMLEGIKNLQGNNEKIRQVSPRKGHFVS